MSLSGSFDDLSEKHLDDLIQAGVPEGLLVDYKAQTYGRADADVREFLKDVSSFANTAGGHLVIGITESGGVPTVVAPLSGIDPDKELQRFESLVRDGLEPRIFGIRMKAIPLAAGDCAIVIRVPRSWNPPHRVSAKNTNRFYGRNSAGAYELSVDDLRRLFLASASAIDRARAFKNERLVRIGSAAGTLLDPSLVGRLIVHIVPIGALSGSPQVDLARAAANPAALRPLNQVAFGGWTCGINFDGFSGKSLGPDQQCFSYVQLFRNGIIEAAMVGIVANIGTRAVIPALDFEKIILGSLPPYINALRDLDVGAPLAIMITLQSVQGARLGVNPKWIVNPVPEIDRDPLELPEILLEDYDSDHAYHQAIRPAVDALWNTAGIAASRYYDADGRWIGEKLA
jgi:hypothetical protein